jgi:hypothetical protein
LRWWYFFNHNTRHGIPTSITISEIIIPNALAYPEPHTYMTFRDLVTVALNVAVTKGVDFGRYNVNSTFNSSWFYTFCAIECKIPSIASIVAIRT